ncbi:hypothetical protein [Cyprinid herpesvirus 3]|uniref:Uncharacterized protein n=1 Tax=Cyprinid herpesvirus 3 TaxID=180230 RepID=A4FTG6_CYHV3|nr:hypothetical protein [Cyprinid herpesvirus 3]
MGSGPAAESELDPSRSSPRPNGLRLSIVVTTLLLGCTENLYGPDAERRRSASVRLSRVTDGCATVAATTRQPPHVRHSRGAESESASRAPGSRMAGRRSGERSLPRRQGSGHAESDALNALALAGQDGLYQRQASGGREGARHGNPHRPLTVRESAGSRRWYPRRSTLGSVPRDAFVR